MHSGILGQNANIGIRQFQVVVNGIRIWCERIWILKEPRSGFCRNRFGRNQIPGSKMQVWIASSSIQILDSKIWFRVSSFGSGSSIPRFWVGYLVPRSGCLVPKSGSEHQVLLLFGTETVRIQIMRFRIHMPIPNPNADTKCRFKMGVCCREMFSDPVILWYMILGKLCFRGREPRLL